MKRMIVKFRDNPEYRAKWRNFCNEIDDEARYEEIVRRLLDYFEENEAAKKDLRLDDQPPRFR